MRLLLLLYIFVLTISAYSGFYYTTPKEMSFEEVSIEIYGTNDRVTNLRWNNQQYSKLEKLPQNSKVKYIAPYYIIQEGDYLDRISFLLLGSMHFRKELLQLNPHLHRNSIEMGQHIYVKKLPPKWEFERRLETAKTWAGKSKLDLTVNDIYHPSKLAVKSCEHKNVAGTSVNLPTGTPNNLSCIKFTASSWKTLFPNTEEGIDVGFRLVKFYNEQNHTAMAESIITMLSKAYPNSAKVDFSIGDMFESKGDKITAQFYYEKAVLKDETYEIALLSLLRVQVQANDVKKAKSTAQKIVERFPHFESLRIVKSALEGNRVPASGE